MGFAGTRDRDAGIDKRERVLNLSKSTEELFKNFVHGREDASCGEVDLQAFIDFRYRACVIGRWGRPAARRVKRIPRRAGVFAWSQHPLFPRP